MDRPQWYSDVEPSRSGGIPPLATWSLTARFIAVLGVIQILQLVKVPVADWLGLQTADRTNPLFWFHYLTYALVHDSHDPWHLIWNAIGLWFFGREIEAHLGRRSYTILCVAAALGGSLCFHLVEVARDSGPSYLVGASGVLTAILVLYAMLWPQRTVILMFIPVRAWILVSILVGVDVYLGAADLIEHRVGTVAHFAHIGGAIVGLVYARYGDRISGGLGALTTRIKQQRAAEREQAAADERQELDRILDKISREGLPSLSRAERHFLEHASKNLRNRR